MSESYFELLEFICCPNVNCPREDHTLLRRATADLKHAYQVRSIVEVES